MNTYKLNTSYKKILGDDITPVNIYLKIRDVFPETILLESSDYHGVNDIYSYICCKPLAGFKVEKNAFKASLPDGQTYQKALGDTSLSKEIADYTNSFEIEYLKFPFITNGLFGYTSFDAVRHFEDIDIKSYPNEERSIPDAIYNVYSFIIVLNHFNNELHIIENSFGKAESQITIDEIISIIKGKTKTTYPFTVEGSEKSNFTDKDFLKVLQKGKDHCHRGDVFQIVLSRRFMQDYQGDDFALYRSLRSINPSPYLFYFDYGSFKLMGSSPEAQIVIGNGEAIIYPIAGTFRRTGDDVKDYELAKTLLNDPKESSEHVMLVDLARNDLSRHCENVKVETYKEVQYYSHVIHLVSKVTGTLSKKSSFAEIVADTFPAGTLSGAPKHMAMKLINQYENENRGFYGGALGYIGFNGEFNHAIMIRTFLSKNNTLFYQAGAGVVDMSVIESELQEVHNKLEALRKAIQMASEI